MAYDESIGHVTDDVT